MGPLSANQTTSLISQDHIRLLNSKNSGTKSHQPMTRQAIEAHFAERAHYQAMTNPQVAAHLGTYDSDRSHNNVVSKELIVKFMEVFKMDAREAKAAVEMEMGKRYAPNPWDAPTWRDHQSSGEEEEEASMSDRAQSSQGDKSSEYSEEQWDLFEKTFG